MIATTSSVSPWLDNRPVPSLDHRGFRPGVLVVMDDEAGCGPLVEALQAQGFRVFPAPTGVAAIEQYALNVEEVDLVLLEAHRQGLDGPDLVTVLRMTDPYLPVCFLAEHERDLAEVEHLNPARSFTQPLALSQVCKALWQLAVGESRPPSPPSLFPDGFRRATAG